MNGWVSRFAATAVAIVTGWSLASARVSGPGSLAGFVAIVEAAGRDGQASKNRPVVAGCPSVSAKFHPCALAKASAFNPPRTPHGEPDLTGLWDAPLAQGFQNIEDFPGDPSPVGFGPAVTVIVDPTDRRSPTIRGRGHKGMRISLAILTPMPSAFRPASRGRWGTSGRDKLRSVRD